MEEGARYPGVALKAGHYESYYLKATHPDGGRGVWIRHTVHKRPGAEPTGSLWFTYFDRDQIAPRATKVTVPAAQLHSHDGEWIRVGSAVIGPGRVAGTISTDALDAAWEFEYDDPGEPCRYLPADWLYRAPLPKTKFVAPVPRTELAGVLSLNGERCEVERWPAMIGHNWGSEHAERWVWLEGTNFESAPDAWFDAGAARVKVAGRVLPWIGFGSLKLDGETHRLGGFRRIRSTVVDAEVGRCDFCLPGPTATVRGRFTAPVKDFVGWIYADPDGPEHHTINCSVADLELSVERPGRKPLQLHVGGCGAFELGMRETDHGVPIQPYPDG